MNLRVAMQVVVCQVFAKSEKRSDVVWIMSDIIFPASYVVFSMSDVVLRTLVAAAFAWALFGEHRLIFLTLHSLC